MITSKCRLSYVYVFEKNPYTDPQKYTAKALFAKTDTKAIKELTDAINDAAARGIDSPVLIGLSRVASSRCTTKRRSTSGEIETSGLNRTSLDSACSRGTRQGARWKETG